MLLCGLHSSEAGTQLAPVPWSGEGSSQLLFPGITICVFVGSGGWRRCSRIRPCFLKRFGKDGEQQPERNITSLEGGLPPSPGEPWLQGRRMRRPADKCLVG